MEEQMKDGPWDSFIDTLPADLVRLNAPLAEYTTIKVGGPASILLEARDQEEIAQAVKDARFYGIPVLLIGAGSNLLIEDAGWEGLVIHFGEQYQDVRLEGNTITAQAGAWLPGIARMAADNGLSGLEFAAGIPASVGGAALMNSGAYGSQMSRVITSVECLDANGDLRFLEREDIGYGYRSSRLMHEGFTVLKVMMTLTPANGEDIWQRINENMAQRRAKQPLTIPSAGSFFKRPEGHFAGALIEQAGLKGYRVGDAEVSHLHAGFLLNQGKASASDFFELVEHIQQTVDEVFGIKLEPEVRIIRQSKA
jgi:UDP-N-acetylmuramate dehydrogenase